MSEISQIEFNSQQDGPSFDWLQTTGTQAVMLSYRSTINLARTVSFQCHPILSHLATTNKQVLVSMSICPARCVMCSACYQPVYVVQLISTKSFTEYI